MILQLKLIQDRLHYALNAARLKCLSLVAYKISTYVCVVTGPVSDIRLGDLMLRLNHFVLFPRAPTEGAEGVGIADYGLVAFLMQNLMENKMRGVTVASKAQTLEKISFEVGILTRESLMARI